MNRVIVTGVVVWFVLMSLAAVMGLHPLPGQTTTPVYIGSPNSVWTTWILHHPLVAGTEHLFRNGVRLSVKVDYTIVSNLMTFKPGCQALAQPGDHLVADYRTQ